MAFTDAEKERVRYHLGYMNVQPAASIQLGFPRPVQTMFLVESALEHVMPVGEDRVRRLLNVLDNIECRLQDAQVRMAATSLGNITLNASEADRLEREYVRWAGRLADQLGVPFYLNSNRFSRGMGGSGNIPVSG